MVMSETSSDDEPVVPPPPSIEMPPSAVPAGAEMWERWRAWETVAAVLEDAQGTMTAMVGTGE